MYELKDYQCILNEEATKVQNFFDKYLDDSILFAKDFKDVNDSKIRTVEPEIMVYGIYNAGKSSILNELIGEDKAQTNDVPTTDKVTYYSWQGYKIADTPGIMAPIEHENVTQEHLKKADVVLFVMSTTGSNERIENYQRMKEIAEAGKKIIIVLNDKNGDLGINDDVIQNIKRQVAINMQKVGIEDVDKKYCIVTVNAMAANDGRNENDSVMLAASGIDELKNIILTELKATTSFEILRGGIRQIENILENFIHKLESNENSELLKQMNQVLQTFNKQKISMRRQINTYIDTQAEMLGDNLPQLIWSNRNDQNKIDEVIKQEINRLNFKIQNEIQRQLTDTASILELELKSFAEIQFDSKSVDAESFKNILSQLSKTESQNTDLDVQSPETKEIDISNVGIATGILTESTATIAANLAKTEIGKAIAKTTIGKLAGTFVPVIGPIITVVSVVSALGKIFGGNDDRANFEAKLQAKNEAERRRVEAEMQARQELNQKCRYLADNISDELKISTDKGIAEILAQYEEPFKTELQKRKNKGEQLSNDILQLREIVNEYDLLRVELGAR